MRHPGQEAAQLALRRLAAQQTLPELVYSPVEDNPPERAGGAGLTLVAPGIGGP